MDLWQEIDYLKERVQTAYGVLSSSGIEIPTELSDMTTYNLSSEISSASVPIQDEWKLPAGWPDLRKVLEEDPFKDNTGVVGRMAILVMVGDNGLPMIRGADYNSFGTWYPKVDTNSYIGFRSSNDPSTYVAANRNTITPIDWDSSKYIVGLNGERYVWFELYYNTANCYWGGGNAAVYVPGLLWICGDNTSYVTPYIRFSRNTRAITNFTFCASQPYYFEWTPLETLPPLSAANQLAMGNILSYTNVPSVSFVEGSWPLSCRSVASFCNNDVYLHEFPDILFEGNQLSNVNSMASNCMGITKYPDTMDYSNVAVNQANFWNYSNHLRQYIQKLPSKMVFPNSLTLSCQINQMGQIYPDTFARFDANDELTGGWVYGWTRNAGWTTELSVKFQTAPAPWMTNDQKADVSAYLHTRGFHIYGL